MSRFMSLFVIAISTLTFILSTPAMALNPQPLPPGLHHSRAVYPAFKHGPKGQHYKQPAIKQTDHGPLSYQTQWGVFLK